MKANKILLVLFSILFVVYFVNASETLRGVNPKVLNNYKQDPFVCDNTKKIPLSRVNDDYCDCKDGTDEPGTNACNNGQFWCRNDDWVGNSILGSHVNDGICDCCDGSDEWQGKVVCKNTCVEKKAEETKKRKELLEKGKRGLLKRDAYKESAKMIYENKRKELEETKKKMGEVTKNIDELENKKSELEAKETIALEIKSLIEKDLSQPVDDKKKDGDNSDDGGPDDVEAAPRMTEEERQNKLAELRKSLGQDDHEQVIQDMNELKIKISQERSEENTLRSKETTLIEFFTLDFGPDNVFVELYDRCFNHQTKEYNYQICFYKKVDQGGTVIGNWKDWKNKYTVMTYEGGASCWNGPTRQTTVYLTCGETENFTSVDEPSKCIYEATFETPAACVPEEIESIQVEDIQF